MICNTSIDVEKAQLVPTIILGKLDYKKFTGPLVINNYKSFNTYFYCGSMVCMMLFTDKYSNQYVCYGSDKGPKQSDICDNCQEMANLPHGCSKCKCKLYCSKVCQLEDWKVHAKMCKSYQKIGHKNVKTRDIVSLSFNRASYQFDAETRGNVNRYEK